MEFWKKNPKFCHTTTLTTLQLNITRSCNLSCKHCHLECGPHREERMSEKVMIRALELARATGIFTVDITGGAPELHPGLPRLLEESRDFHRILRTNLTVLLEPEKEGLMDLYREHQVELFASLPFYKKARTDRQRGEGVYEDSLKVLKKLNERGYGENLILNLVYNPPGAILPGSQEELEKRYREKLKDLGVTFTHLYTITNMPIGRFLTWLIQSGNEAEYRKLLEESYNPLAHEAVMCRSMISVDTDGSLYDCDFNLALHAKAQTPGLWERDRFEERRIVTGPHCFACTAGAGSS